MSMTLTALLLGMLSAGVYSVVNEWRSETSVLDDTLDKTLIVLQIERALLGAFPHSYIDQDRLARFVYFQGADNELSWVSTVSPQRQSGLTAWRLQSDAVDGLSLRLAPAFGDNPDFRLEEATPSVLLPNYEAEFSYLLQENPDEKAWLDEWVGEERQSLPIAVYIRLTPINDDRDEEMELVIPIKTFEHEDIRPVDPGI